MGILDKVEAQELEKKKDSFVADMDDKLDEKALRRACKVSQGSSVLVDLGNEKQIDKAIKSMRGFDYRVIAMINRWSNSEHPERVVEKVVIDGKNASEYMRENGYSFMDCMVLAQNAVRNNKPGVEFDMEVTGKQQRHDQKMNLSDPNLKHIPPSHMPKKLNSILKIASFGFFQNREERANHKKELELIRMAAIEREKQSRLEKADKSAYAQEVKRKKEQNRLEAEKGKKLQQEYELSQRDEIHSKEGLEALDAYQKKSAQKLEQLGKRREALVQKAAGNQKRMAELEKSKESMEKWILDNPDWKNNPDKRKAFAGMMKNVREYDEARKEHEQIGHDMAKIHKTSEKFLTAMAEMEGKRPRMTELYRKQAQHTLTDEDRKELEALEKPGSVMEGKRQVIGARVARAEMAMKQHAPDAQKAKGASKQEPDAVKQVNETAKQQEKAAEKPQETKNQNQGAFRKGQGPESLYHRISEGRYLSPEAFKSIREAAERQIALMKAAQENARQKQAQENARQNPANAKQTQENTRQNPANAKQAQENARQNQAKQAQEKAKQEQKQAPAKSAPEKKAPARRR